MKKMNLLHRRSSATKRVARWFLPALMMILLTITTLASFAQVNNIVLVHGAFADGSGWKAVYDILTKRGYHVSMVGNPNTGMPDDVAATKRVLDRQDGPVILVGHSYGGAIITEAGNEPNVVGLVYVSAFAPDSSESLGQLAQAGPPNPSNAMLPPQDGFLWIERSKFHASFCADVPDNIADFMADAQIPLAASVFGYVMPKAAWRTKPSWYCVATEDKTIPPDAERFMAKRMGAKVYEIKSSHVIFLSHPKEVADIIEAAAKATGK